MTTISDAYGAKPKDLSDPASIARELAQEAAEDIGSAVSEFADEVDTQAGRALDAISQPARAVYDHSWDIAKSSFRSAIRFSERHPLEALLIAGGAAFVIGCLTQIRRR
jgi:hypothetical protein